LMMTAEIIETTMMITAMMMTRAEALMTAGLKDNYQ
jgi:hypothetical protein